MEAVRTEALTATPPPLRRRLCPALVFYVYWSRLRSAVATLSVCRHFYYYYYYYYYYYCNPLAPNRARSAMAAQVRSLEEQAQAATAAAAAATAAAAAAAQQMPNSLNNTNTSFNNNANETLNSVNDSLNNSLGAADLAQVREGETRRKQTPLRKRFCSRVLVFHT